MRLTIFHADKGDCLLLTGKDGRSILCDGGMPSAFPDLVATKLRAHLPRKGGLDVVYVSHIDEDHIGGVLKLLDQAFEWRVFKLHKSARDPSFKAPSASEPPAIRNLWHNAFHELVEGNVGHIQAMLAANALSLRLVDASWARHAGAVSANLANSIPQAIRVSQRVGANQLDIPLNKPAAGHLMMVQNGKNGRQNTAVGGMHVTIIGPAPQDLVKLRAEWNEWLRRNADQLDRLREQMERDEDRLAAAFPPVDAARLVSAVKALGDRGKVTPPNLASLMLHVEEDGRTLLLTGDGHSDDVEAGLEATGKLARGKGLHVDILKVPHHGSEYNTTRTFPTRITADHYVFCGNGFSDNPDLDVLSLYLDSRLGTGKKVSRNPEATRPFHFWFSAAADLVAPKYRPHMRKVEKLVRDRAKASGGKLKAHFLEDDPLVLELD